MVRGGTVSRSDVRVVGAAEVEEERPVEETMTERRAERLASDNLDTAPIEYTRARHITGYRLTADEGVRRVEIAVQVSGDGQAWSDFAHHHPQEGSSSFRSVRSVSYPFWRAVVVGDVTGVGGVNVKFMEGER